MNLYLYFWISERDLSNMKELDAVQLISVYSFIKHIVLIFLRMVTCGKTFFLFKLRKCLNNKQWTVNNVIYVDTYEVSTDQKPFDVDGMFLL